MITLRRLRAIATSPAANRLGIAAAVSGLIWVSAQLVKDTGSLAAVGSIGWVPVLGASALIAAGEGIHAVVFASNVRGAGGRVGLGPAIAVHFVSGFARFLPGGVATYLARAGMLGGLAAGLGPVTVSLGVETALSLAAALSIAVAGILAGMEIPIQVGVPLIVASIAVLVVGSRLVPRLVRRVAANESLRLSRTVVSFGAYLAAWSAFGASFWVIAEQLAPRPGPSVIVVAGAAATAWFVGFVAVPVPNGIGVREAVLSAVLAPWLGTGGAAAAAIVHRVLWTAVIFAAGIVSLPLVGRGYSDRSKM